MSLVKVDAKSKLMLHAQMSLVKVDANMCVAGRPLVKVDANII